MIDKKAILSSPELIPADEQQTQQLQDANKHFWENNPMRYDWRYNVDDGIKYEEFSKEFYKEIDRRFFEATQTFLPSKENPFDQLIPFEELPEYNVLEIGVGNGSHAQLLASKAKAFTGIDLTSYAVKSTTNRFKVFNLNGEIKQMDAEKMSLPSETFDFIWSWGVIHHSSNTSKIIDEIKRVLKPGGKCVIMVYYRGWWHYYLRGYLFYGLLNGKIFKNGLHEILQKTTDGALARYYTGSSWKKFINSRLLVMKTQVMGEKKVLFPIPNGSFKNFFTSIFPNQWTRFLTNSCRMGGFLVIHMQKK